MQSTPSHGSGSSSKSLLEERGQRELGQQGRELAGHVLHVTGRTLTGKPCPAVFPALSVSVPQAFHWLGTLSFSSFLCAATWPPTRGPAQVALEQMQVDRVPSQSLGLLPPQQDSRREEREFPVAVQAVCVSCCSVGSPSFSLAWEELRETRPGLTTKSQWCSRPGGAGVTRFKEFPVLVAAQPSPFPASP